MRRAAEVVAGAARLGSPVLRFLEVDSGELAGSERSEDDLQNGAVVAVEDRGVVRAAIGRGWIRYARRVELDLGEDVRGAGEKARRETVVESRVGVFVDEETFEVGQSTLAEEIEGWSGEWNRLGRRFGTARNKRRRERQAQ
jgi:hypothetical protein